MMMPQYLLQQIYIYNKTRSVIIKQANKTQSDQESNGKNTLTKPG